MSIISKNSLLRSELFFTFVLFLSACLSAAQMDRQIPAPLPNHPGNIFLAGEDVNVPLTGEKNWTAIDYDGNIVVQGKVKNGRAALGKLPPGYYELHVDGARRTTIGVLAPLVAPTPQSSPISIDAAMAWFYNKSEQPEVANLCALAGINWVRDRLSWNEMEPVKGRFVKSSRYDNTANCQSACVTLLLSSAKWHIAGREKSARLNRGMRPISKGSVVIPARKWRLCRRRLISA